MLSACSEEANVKDEDIEPIDSEVVSILVWENISEDSYLNKYITEIKRDKEMDVKVIAVEANTEEEYLEKLNTRLYTDKGPTLIYVPSAKFDKYKVYMDKDFTLKDYSKIENSNNIYENLKYDSEGFIPIGMTPIGISLKIDRLEELGIDIPDVDWSLNEYQKVKEQWLSVEKRRLTGMQYWEEVIFPLYELNIWDKKKNNVNLASEELVSYINNANDRIYSKYELVDDDYEALYRRFNDNESKEYRDEFSFWSNMYDSNKYPLDSSTPILEPYIAEQMGREVKGNDIKRKYYPDVTDKYNSLYTWGFIINKNHPKVKEGVEFVNLLLSDKAQFDMYKMSNVGYPVVKTVEGDIRKYEEENGIHLDAIELRREVISRIESGEIKPRYKYDNLLGEDFYEMLEKDLLKFIITDKDYSEDELIGELRKLENKYNIWLRE